MLNFPKLKSEELKMNANQRVENAISNIKRIDAEYWNNTLKQRLFTGAGSVTYFRDNKQLETALLESEWKEYSHPDITQGCTAFSTIDIPGELGIINIISLPMDTELTLDDRKLTGKLSVCVDHNYKVNTEFTVIILGFEEDDNEIVYTFHPGPPIKPSTLVGEIWYGYGIPISIRDGEKITVADALNLGFTYAKAI